MLSISDSEHRVPTELGQESQASSCVEEWNSAGLSSCSLDNRPLVELCVEPAVLSGRCMGPYHPPSPHHTEPSPPKQAEAWLFSRCIPASRMFSAPAMAILSHPSGTTHLCPHHFLLHHWEALPWGPHIPGTLPHKRRPQGPGSGREIEGWLNWAGQRPSGSWPEPT